MLEVSLTYKFIAVEVELTVIKLLLVYRVIGVLLERKEIMELLEMRDLW